MRKYKLCVILLIVALAAACGVQAQVAAFAPPETIVSTETILSADKLRAGDSFELAVRATVKEGYHVGAADRDALYPAKLSLDAPKGIAFEKPIYPKAERKAFAIAPDEKIPVYEGTVIIRVKGRVAEGLKPGRVEITSKLDTQACTDDQCFPPELSESRVSVEVAGAGASVARVNQDVFRPEPADAEPGRAAAATDRLASMGLIQRLVWLYLGGLLLAFTPCVYPMIPVTVGYFSNQSTRGKGKTTLLAAVYVLGISLTYSALGVIAATTGDAFGAAMQKPAVQIGIAGLLVALALSMFGLYELQAPSFIQSKASGRSGFLGALFMGLIFGLVAAPCVGPVVISLMAYVAKLGSPAMGFLLFFALSLGLGTPLFFLAAFSARMPMPGMWMVAVKKLAGFLLVGAAAYFVLPLVPDKIGRFLIPAVVLAAGIYLGCFEKSIRSSRLTASFGKAFCVVAVVAAVVMVAPGGPRPALEWEPYTTKSIAQAAGVERPSMVDFTAEWCGVCKELEHGPLSDPRVIETAQRFQRYRVDGTNRDAQVRAAERKYGVKGYPTIIFFDSSGQEVESARIISFVKSEEMIKRMESVE